MSRRMVAKSRQQQQSESAPTPCNRFQNVIDHYQQQTGNTKRRTKLSNPQAQLKNGSPRARDLSSSSTSSSSSSSSSSSKSSSSASSSSSSSPSSSSTSSNSSSSASSSLTTTTTMARTNAAITNSNRGSHISTSTKSNSAQSEPDKTTSYLLHRNREQPTPNPNVPPLGQIKFYLDKYKIKEASQIFFHEDTLKLLRDEPDFMWVAVQLICQRLSGLCQYRFRVFEGCERMLCRIAVDENCNPKEVLLCLLTEISNPDDSHPEDDNIFRAMIRPLEGTLLRMASPSPRNQHFREVINTLMRHIDNIELPCDYNIEGKKRLSLANDASVKRFIEVLPLMLSFIEELNDKPLDLDRMNMPMPVLTESQINEVLNGELIDDSELSDVKPFCSDTLEVTLNALMQLMNRPFTYLDLTTHCRELRRYANRYLSSLLRLQPNLFAPIYRMIQHNTIHDNCDAKEDNWRGLSFKEDYETALSRATCYYLYRCEKQTPLGSLDFVQSFPQVITHESMLICCLPYVLVLLKKNEPLVHEKGLLLLENLLRYLERDSLDKKFYDEVIKEYKLHEQLFSIMIYSSLNTNRRRAYDVFTTICDLLTHDCKLKVFRLILERTDLRPCIKAATIDQYRKHLTNIYKVLFSLHDRLELITKSTESGLDQASQAEQADLLATSGTIIKQIDYWQTKYRQIGCEQLTDFLDLCIRTSLPDKQQSNVFDNYEIILATLSLFRYLRLRSSIVHSDHEMNYVNNKSRLKKIFFQPLKITIETIMKDIKSYKQDKASKDQLDAAQTSKRPTQNKDVNSQQQPDQLGEQNFLSRFMQMIGGGGGLEEDPQNSESNRLESLDYVLCRLELLYSVLVRTCGLYNC